MKIKKYIKPITLGIFFTLFISTLIAIILFFIFNDKSVETSLINKTNIIINVDDKTLTIPNVTEKNTTFKISDTKNKVESINISVTDRLSDYNLYYCLNFDNNNEVINEDYLIFNDLILLLEENCTILFKYELNGNFSNEYYEIKISNIEIKEKQSTTKNNTNSSTSNIKTEKVTTTKTSATKPKEQQKNKNNSTQTNSPYFIKVNYKANVVTIYSKDKNGNYTVPYKAMICSCGKFTPKSGTYKTSNKYVWRSLINNVYGHYATRIVNKILFHSVPYTSANNNALEYWEYDKLGQTASEGCVRLTVKDAKWIYNNCPSGTMVEFYSDSNPGPLGKPTAQKISSNKECRDWDPTDPNSNNPWHSYKDKEKTENTTSNNTTNNTTNNIINNSNSTIVNNITNTNTPIVDNSIINKPSVDDKTIINNELNINETPGNNSIINESKDNKPFTNNTNVYQPVIDNSSTNTTSVNSSNTIEPINDII